MSAVLLLDALKIECKKAVKGLKLSVKTQQGDMELTRREPAIHLMRLPESRSYEKIAPYIIVQFVTGKHNRVEPPKPHNKATVRFICCVYDSDEEQGALNLLNVMTAVQMHLLKLVKIGKCFTLDPDAGIEMIVYTNDSAPFYGGELVADFFMPPIEQEVDLVG